MRLGMVMASVTAATLGCPAALRADSMTMRPVYVYSVGPQRIRIRVAIGNGLPCSSSSNRVLLEGPLEPRQWVMTESPQLPICVEHTYGAFPDTEWSPSVWLPPHCGSKAGCILPPVVRVIVSSNAN